MLIKSDECQWSWQWNGQAMHVRHLYRYGIPRMAWWCHGIRVVLYTGSIITWAWAMGHGPWDGWMDGWRVNVPFDD